MTDMDVKRTESLLKNIGQEAAQPLLKGVLFIIFWVLENFYVDDNFKCPCYSTKDMREENCFHSKIYSILFMVLTTFAAGFLGFCALAAIKFFFSCGRNPECDVQQHDGVRGPARGQTNSSVVQDNNVQDVSDKNQQYGGEDRAASAPENQFELRSMPRGTGQQSGGDGSAAGGQTNRSVAQNNNEQDDRNQQHGGEDSAASALEIHLEMRPMTRDYLDSQEFENNLQKECKVTVPKDSKVRIYYGFRQKYCCKKFLEAFVIGLAWGAILLIDGDYVACVSTCDPYGNATCTDIRGLPHDELPVTPHFAWWRRISQYIGFALTFLVLLLIGILKFCRWTCKCCKSQCSSCTDGACCACCFYSENLEVKEKGITVEGALLLIKDIAPKVAVKPKKDQQTERLESEA